MTIYPSICWRQTPSYPACLVSFHRLKVMTFYLRNNPWLKILFRVINLCSFVRVYSILCFLLCCGILFLYNILVIYNCHQMLFDCLLYNYIFQKNFCLYLLQLHLVLKFEILNLKNLY